MAEDHRGGGNGSGYITWRDWDAHVREESRLRHRQGELLSQDIAGIELRRLEDRRALDSRIDQLVSPEFDHEQHHRELRAWRSEMRGMVNAVRFAFGTSVLAAVVTFIQLWQALNR